VKLLVLSQHYWPESFRINEVVESLQSAGCVVTVLTGQPNYPDGRLFDGFRAWRCGTEQHPSGYTVSRVPLIPRGRSTALRLIANYLSFLASACSFGPWLLRGKRFDVVFVYGTSPILQVIAGVLLKRIKGAVLVTWVQDLWPQSLEVTGFVKNKYLLAIVSAVVRWIYRHSDLVLVQSPALVEEVAPMAGGRPVEYHPNPGEAAFGHGAELGRVSLVLDSGFNVVFAGNLGTVQALDTILEAAHLLRGHSDIRFVLVGSGSRLEWLREQVSLRGLFNVSLPGRFDAECMPAILAQASALLVSLVQGPAMAQTVPSKIQAYLAAGRPIIAALEGEGARVVTEASAGISCAGEDAAALAQAVRELFSASAEDLRRMGEAGRRYYEQHFEPTALAERLVKRLAHLVAERERLAKES